MWREIIINFMLDLSDFFAQLLWYIRTTVWEFLIECVKATVYSLLFVAYLLLPAIASILLPEDTVSLDVSHTINVFWLLANTLLCIFAACIAIVMRDDTSSLPLRMKVRGSLGRATYYFFWCLITFAILFGLLGYVDYLKTGTFFAIEA